MDDDEDIVFLQDVVGRIVDKGAIDVTRQVRPWYPPPLTSPDSLLECSSASPATCQRVVNVRRFLHATLDGDFGFLAWPHHYTSADERRLIGWTEKQLGKLSMGDIDWRFEPEDGGEDFAVIFEAHRRVLEGMYRALTRPAFTLVARVPEPLPGPSKPPPATFDEVQRAALWALFAAKNIYKAMVSCAAEEPNDLEGMRHEFSRASQVYFATSKRAELEDADRLVANNFSNAIRAVRGSWR